MKKTLLALAALTATAGALAQSSVNLYGAVDLSLSKSTDQSAQMTGNANAVDTSGLRGINNGNSRFGLLGTEDLGNGLKASFNYEAGINPETGKTDTNTFQRAANLSLSGNFGSVYMGRGVSTGFLATAAYEITGMANYSALANMFGGATGGGFRTSSEFRYTTPNISGLTASLGYIAKLDNGGSARTDMNAIYTNGPIAAALAYSKVQNQEKSYSLGGAYDFGMFKVAASYQDPAGAQKGYTLGGLANFGVTSVAFDVARDTGSAVKSTDYVLEGRYTLSKRTFAYAALYRDGRDDTAGGSLKAVNTYGVGIRHNF